MRLVELRANQPGFRVVRFNPSGVTLILGRKSQPADRDRKKTYNGVGKSLIIALVHFCLGSKVNKNEFKKKLSGWWFELELQLKNEMICLRRETANPKTIFWNKTPLPVEDVTARLAMSAFDIPEGVEGLSFRSLISRFVRPSRKSYSSFYYFNPGEEKDPYSQLLNNTFLLGYDPFLLQDKMRLKKHLDQTVNDKKRLQEDPVTRDFFEADRALLPIEIFALEESIRDLEKSLESFKVAKDFRGKEDEAQNVKRDLRRLGNKIVVVRNNLASIRKSLEIRDDIPLDRVKALYGEAGLFFSEQQLKDLEDVVHFHKSLTQKRQARLLRDRQKLEQSLKDLEKENAKAQENLNRLLAYLGEHGALDEYRLLSQQLADDKTRLEKLKVFKTLLSEYEKKEASLKEDLELENQKTADYLADFESVDQLNNQTFRSFSRVLYKNKPGGISVVNNARINKQRLNLEVHIHTDSSDGINEAKIFCFDATLLLRRHNHHVDFLFHDSRLFSEIDPRQRATIFKEAMRFSHEAGVQYIASINEDGLQAAESYLETGDAAALRSCVVLELTDESPEAKLLGMDIDLRYED